MHDCRVAGERWKAFLRQYPDLSLPAEMQKATFRARMARLRAAFLDECPSFTAVNVSFNEVRFAAIACVRLPPRCYSKHTGKRQNLHNVVTKALW